MTKIKECNYCGQKRTNHIDVIEDVNTSNKMICTECIKFEQFEFKHNNHFSWIIQTTLNSLEKKINKYQKEVIILKEADKFEMPHCNYKLTLNSRRKRIKCLNQFLDQCYYLHKWLTQMFKIVNYSNTINYAKIINTNVIKKEK